MPHKSQTIKFRLAKLIAHAEAMKLARVTAIAEMQLDVFIDSFFPEKYVSFLLNQKC